MPQKVVVTRRHFSCEINICKESCRDGPKSEFVPLHEIGGTEDNSNGDFSLWKHMANFASGKHILLTPFITHLKSYKDVPYNPNLACRDEERCTVTDPTPTLDFNGTSEVVSKIADLSMYCEISGSLLGRTLLLRIWCCGLEILPTSFTHKRQYLAGDHKSVLCSLQCFTRVVILARHHYEGRRGRLSLFIVDFKFLARWNTMSNKPNFVVRCGKKEYPKVPQDCGDRVHWRDSAHHVQ